MTQEEELHSPESPWGNRSLRQERAQRPELFVDYTIFVDSGLADSIRDVLNKQVAREIYPGSTRAAEKDIDTEDTLERLARAFNIGSNTIPDKERYITLNPFEARLIYFLQQQHLEQLERAQANETQIRSARKMSTAFKSAFNNAAQKGTDHEALIKGDVFRSLGKVEYNT